MEIKESKESKECEDTFFPYVQRVPNSPSECVVEIEINYSKESSLFEKAQDANKHYDEHGKSTHRKDLI